MQCRETELKLFCFLFIFIVFVPLNVALVHKKMLKIVNGSSADLDSSLRVSLAYPDMAPKKFIKIHIKKQKKQNHIYCILMSTEIQQQNNFSDLKQ